MEIPFVCTGTVLTVKNSNSKHGDPEKRGRPGWGINHGQHNRHYKNDNLSHDAPSQPRSQFTPQTQTIEFRRKIQMISLDL